MVPESEELASLYRKNWEELFQHSKPYGSMGSPIKGQFLTVDKPYNNMLNVGDRSVSQERRRLRDRLSDDRNAQNLFKGLLGKCND